MATDDQKAFNPQIRRLQLSYHDIKKPDHTVTVILWWTFHFLKTVLRLLQMGSDFQCSASLAEISSLLQITSQLPLWKSARPLYYIISCLWARSNISGTARSAEAQYYSLACDQFSNGFARHCWAPNNRMWSANWWTGQTPSCAAPRASSSGWISNQKHHTTAATLMKTSIPTFFVQSYCILESVCECM